MSNDIKLNSVYLVKFPNNKVYVGITCQSVDKRISRHKLDAKNNSQYKFHRALRKYGEVEVCILERNLTRQEANKKEMYYIEKYDSFNFGYNSTLGGDNPSENFIYSENSLEGKISFREKITKKFKCPKYTEKRRQITKKACNTTKARNNMSLAKGSKLFSAFCIKTNKKMGTWLNQVICAEDLGVHRSGVGKCLRGEMRTHKGYRFSYE